MAARGDGADGRAAGFLAVDATLEGLELAGEGSQAFGGAALVFLGAAGALALGAFLVVGFAIHNTTEGLAIVAPIAHLRPSLGRLAVLGLVAGAPAVLGAWIGAAAFNASLAAFLFGSARERSSR